MEWRDRWRRRSERADQGLGGGHSHNGADTVVVVPTYNEAANIDRLLEGLYAAVPAAHVLVVDDNSPDGTAARVRSRPEIGTSLFILDRPGKQGLGAAYRAGFAWSLEHGYANIVQMDADLSHPAVRVPALLDALAEADIAVGSRYVPGGAVRNWAWQRRVISRVGNIYVALVLGLGVRDATAGFKAFRREALLTLGVLDSQSEGYSFQIENAWRARRLGLRVAEVPITFSERAEGTSKMSFKIVAEALLRVPLWRAREIWQDHSDMPAFLAVGGAGYVVDVLAFNALLGSMSPTQARTIALVPAMLITYLGNRFVTWRGRHGRALRRELCLFIVFNLIGFGFSILCLWISHDLIGLHNRAADNISANVVGVGLGTVFRYLTYRRFVFEVETPPEDPGSTLARCTSWWSTTKSALFRSSATTSKQREQARRDAMTG